MKKLIQVGLTYEEYKKGVTPEDIFKDIIKNVSENKFKIKLMHDELLLETIFQYQHGKKDYIVFHVLNTYDLTEDSEKYTFESLDENSLSAFQNIVLEELTSISQKGYADTILESKGPENNDNAYYMTWNAIYSGYRIAISEWYNATDRSNS